MPLERGGTRKPMAGLISRFDSSNHANMTNKTNEHVTLLMTSQCLVLIPYLPNAERSQPQPWRLWRPCVWISLAIPGIHFLLVLVIVYSYM